MGDENTYNSNEARHKNNGEIVPKSCVLVRVCRCRVYFAKQTIVVFVIDGKGWKRDLTRECVEPNPGFDKTWSREQVSGWLKGLDKNYYFAEKLDGLTGEELYGLLDAQIKELVADVKDESKKFFMAFCNRRLASQVSL